MWLQALRRYLTGGHVIGRTLVLADVYEATRTQYLHASVASGLLQALRRPRTKDELVDELHVVNVELLDALLSLGVGWRELRERDGRYSLKGRRSKALASAVGDPFIAHVQESTWYSGSVYSELAARIRGAPPGNYLTQSGALVARSSRVAEPPTAAFFDDVLRTIRPRSMLDIGCGSGIYLRQAVQHVEGLKGVGLEYSPEAAALASANIAAWSLGSRVRIVEGDIRDPALDLGERFDLVTLFHNLYYFDEWERAPLFSRIDGLMDGNATLAIVSLFRSRTRVASHFEVIFRSTTGNTPLPNLEQTIDVLNGQGYRVSRPKRLVPFEALYGLVAHRTR